MGHTDRLADYEILQCFGMRFAGALVVLPDLMVVL